MLEEHKWYYAKLGQANKYLPQLLNSNPRSVVTFFDAAADLATWRDAGGRDGPQKKAFFNAQSVEASDTTRIAVLSDDTVYLLKPSAKPARVLTADDTAARFGNVGDNTAKLLDVLPACQKWKLPFAEVPHVVASMTANQSLSQRTFVKVEDPGNIIGLEWLTDPASGNAAYGRLATQYGESLLFWCLSSVQMETLVAKLCEESGCFVPAYLAGTMKAIDLFAYNDGATTLHLGELEIAPNQKVSIQVKRGPAPSSLADDVYYVTLDSRESPRCLGLQWLLNRLRESPCTKRWLIRALNWLPAARRWADACGCPCA